MNKKPVVLCILDGFGIYQPYPGNAIALANTPVMDKLLQKYPHTSMAASGNAVGLPAGQMGNSEVGHLTIGAGRVVYTGLSLINKDLTDNQYQNKVGFLKIFELVKQRQSQLHVMGLISNGGVHSHQQHLIAFLNLAKKHNVSYVLHGFSDGRDVKPNSAVHDFATVDQVVQATNGKWGVIAGRYYAMDRDCRWERTELVYQAITQNQCDHRYNNVVDYIQQSYDQNITDEFILPALPQNFEGYQLTDNDIVFFFNFRPDRARQLCHLIRGSTPGLYDYQPKSRAKNIYLVSLMKYEKIHLDDVIYPPFEITNTLGEVFAKRGLKQLRIAETEKYAHVTFFFDGGKEAKFSNCDRLLVPSQKVATYDLKPAMSANEITDHLIPKLKKYDVIILNFANPDMVGHTGALMATVKAVEVVDYQIGIIHKALMTIGGTMFIVADHGNAEIKLDLENKPVTSHSTSPVPFLMTDCSYNLVQTNCSLSDVAPTILSYLKIAVPKEMTGKNLLINRKSDQLCC